MRPNVPRALAALLWVLAVPTVASADEARPQGSSGVHVRAAGHEPEWTFAVYPDGRVSFDEHRGPSVVLTSLPLPNQPSRPGGFVYGARSDAQEIVAEIAAVSCTDTKSGERFSHQVTVRVDGREYRGCGAVGAPVR